MKKRVMLILSCLLLSLGYIVAQTTRITGTVVDETGEPLVGATVMVKGTSTGVVTELDGTFSINVPEGRKTLVFSLMGMKNVEAQAVPGMRIVLTTSETALSEAIIIGYGTARKVGTITGSVSTVSGQAVEMKPTGNAIDMLEGKVAGLQVSTSSGEPTATSVVRIRGVGSLNAGTTPLYILDGVPTTTNIMMTLNNNDIESMTVLKDASATSIYGARAANGVIYITTKKGSRGAKGRITISANYGISSLARRIGNPMNTAEVAGLQLKTGNISQTKYDAIMASGIDTNWQDWYFKDDAPTSQQNISFSGGNEKTTYYISGGHFKQEGITDRSTYERYNARINIDSRVNDWLRIGVNIGGSYDKRQANGFTYSGSNSVYGGISASMNYLPYYSPYDENGNELIVFPEMGGMYSVKYLMDTQPSETNVANILASEYVEITPIEGLTIRSQANIDAYDQRRSTKRLNTPEGLYVPRVTEDFWRNAYLSITNTAEYRFDLDRTHYFTVLIGQEGIKDKYEAFGLITSKQPNNYLMNLNHGEEVLLSDVTHSQYEYVYSSFFGRANYNYNEKYYVDFSLRNDGSSRFGPNNRRATFLSGGLLWDAKQENFLKDVDILSDLRIKFSVGSQGNSSIDNYKHMASIGTGNYNTTKGWQVTDPGNPDLKWEQNIQTTLSFNAGFVDNRYRGEISFYNRKTKDMLLDTPNPGTSGYTSYLMNIGEMTNKGIEVELNAEFIRTRDFSFNVGARIAYNKNVIDELFYGIEEWPMLNYLTSYRVGKPKNLYMPKFAGIDPANGMQLWYVPGTNELTSEYDQESLSQDTGKQDTAPYIGGFDLYFRWKDLSVRADFSFSLNKWLVNNDKYFDHNPAFFAGGDNQSKDLLTEMWLEHGDVGKKWPKYGTGLQFDDRLLENASYVRLKDLTVSYNLPKSLLSKTNFFDAVRIFATGRNLFTITKYDGPDPTIQSNLLLGNYPSTRQYVIGLEVAF